VTEKRNGCTDTVSKTVSIYDFGILLANNLEVTGEYVNNSIVLRWSDLNQDLVGSYEIEKYTGDNGFIKIGTTTLLSFTDDHPQDGNNMYRIKAISKTGLVYYSGILTVVADAARLQSFYLTGNSPGAGGMTLVANTGMAANAVIVIYNLTGQKLQQRNVQLSKGRNMIDLPAADGRQMSIQVISLFINGQVAYSQKMIL